MTRKLVLGMGVAIAFAMVGATSTTASATGYGYGQGYGHGYGVHCMKYGETLWGVAYRYGVSANALAAHNGIHNPNYVRAGTCLHIPPRGSGYGYGSGYGKGYGHDYDKGYGKGYGHDSGKGYNAGYGSGYGYGKKMGNRYCVRHGDTLYSIARYYGTSAWAIANANGIYNPNYIRAGSCLIIPGY